MIDDTIRTVAKVFGSKAERVTKDFTQILNFMESQEWNDTRKTDIFKYVTIVYTDIFKELKHIDNN